MRRGAASLLVAIAACSQGPAERPPREVAPVTTTAVTAEAIAAAAPPPRVACAEVPGVTLFASPASPKAGAPLRVIAVSDRPLDATLRVRAEGGEVAAARDRHGGPPYWWFAELPAPAAGSYHVLLDPVSVLDPVSLTVPAGAPAACRAIDVAEVPVLDTRRAWGAVWAVRAAWDKPMEDLYSAWIEHLFDAPLDEQPTWPALHEVLRDPKRNFLHDHLGAGEDDAGLVLDPDCADLPYFLRAYFAFKLGLPFGYSSCTRGGGGLPPRCLRWHSNLEDASRRSNPVDVFGDFLRITVADAVHSGTGRTPAEDDNTDTYPVPLDASSLRPGTIYADPYGHVLVVAKRIAQTETSGGVLLAVDGQPDGTVARRRFWRGNFLFALDPALGSPGFKHFRPVVMDRGRPRPLTNRELMADPAYADYSLDQYGAGVDGFYDRMEDVLSPSPLDPEKAMLETIQALEEQVHGRVLSIRNGQKYIASGGKTVDMPEGPSILETTGPWEDFSTPSRDLRLLIAIDIVRDFPDHVARRPERYAMPAGKAPEEVRSSLLASLTQELRTRRVSYERSDGSPFTLTLAEVMERSADLEMAYDPNDCAETRWGAPAGSDEASTCSRHAPWAQVARMRKVRSWFHERRRPPRP